MAKKTTAKKATKTKASKTSAATKAKAAPKAGSKAALRAALVKALPIGSTGVSPEAAITALLEFAFDIADDHDIEISLEE